MPISGRGGTHFQSSCAKSSNCEIESEGGMRVWPYSQRKTGFGRSSIPCWTSDSENSASSGLQEEQNHEDRQYCRYRLRGNIDRDRRHRTWAAEYGHVEQRAGNGDGGRCQWEF